MMKDVYNFSLGSCGCCPEKAPVYINVFKGVNVSVFIRTKSKSVATTEGGISILALIIDRPSYHKYSVLSTSQAMCISNKYLEISFDQCNFFIFFQSQNYLMQGAKVEQSGNSNTLGSLGFRDLRSPRGLDMSKNSTIKDMSYNEIASLIKVGNKQIFQ